MTNFWKSVSLVGVALIAAIAAGDTYYRDLPAFPQHSDAGQRPNSNLPPFPILDQSNRAPQSSDTLSNDRRYNRQAAATVARSVMQIGQNIMTTVLRTSGESAEVISPLSVTGALSLLMLGAKARTFQELVYAMGFNQDQALSADPYKIHEQFGLLIDAMMHSDGGQKKSVPELSRNPPFPSLNSNNGGSGSGSGGGHTILGDPGTPDASDFADHKIVVANGVFVQNGFSIRPDYRAAVQSCYSSEVRNFDFAREGGEAKRIINEWVSSKTNGRINDILVDDVHPATKVILISALHFSAKWETTFYAGGTKTKPFYPDGVDKQLVMVEMMANGGDFLHYESSECDCQMIGLPYKDKISTMYIILPNNGNRKKTIDLQSSLTPEKLDAMIEKMTLKTAIVLFPKMHLTRRLSLNSILSAMGIQELFNVARSDLSLIAESDANSVAPPASYASAPHTQRWEKDDDDVPPLIFSRVGEDTDHKSGTKRKRRSVSYKTESEFKQAHEPIRSKDFFLHKRISKANPGKKLLRRSRRQAYGATQSLQNLDNIRRQGPTLRNPGLFAGEIAHKIDLIINEKGTEGGAATSVALTRTGTSVVFRAETPFIFMIRHEETKFPIFYGTVFDPRY